MRFLKIWFIIPLMVVSLFATTSTPIYAEAFKLPSNESSSIHTYKAASLTDIEKIVRESMGKREVTVVIKYKGSTNKLIDMISGYISKAIAQDEYLNYSYRSVNISYKAYGTDVTVTIKNSYYESAEEMKYVDQKVKSILTNIIKPTMNDHEKVKAVHDYLVQNLAYDTQLVNNSPYPALTKGITACNGYAMLVYKMLKELGIDVRLISGTASSQAFNTQNHAWNLVKLDGNWYHLDATWDDPVPDEKGRILYDYYLLTDKEISKNHSWKNGGVNGEEKPYPASTKPYVDLLQAKLLTPNENDRYLALTYSIGLQYLLPENTATSLSELRKMVKTQFADYKKTFTIRYIDKYHDLEANLRQLIYNSAEEKNVRSWRYGAIPYMRGTTSDDQLINVSDIIYQYSAPKQSENKGVRFPTDSHLTKR